MVVDANDSASVWMNGHYSLYWVPTNYFDGGHSVIIGASSETTFRDRIVLAGAREVVPLELQVSFTWLGDATMDIHVELSQAQGPNQGPLVPITPTGSSLAVTDMEYAFSTVTDDPELDQIYYMWHFGDDSTDWLGPYDSGSEAEAQQIWDSAGTYNVKVKAKDTHDNETDWSGDLSVLVKLCGDAATDGQVDIDDAVLIVTYVLGGGAAPEPLEVGDVNCADSVDIDDATYLIAYIFSGGPAPCFLCP
jgi:hypothetical protein